MNISMKGYTLIELMIILGIVGMLASIAVPTFNGYTARAQQTKAMEDITEIAQAMTRFYTENQFMTNTPASIGMGPVSVIVNPYYTFNIITSVSNTSFYQITGTKKAGVAADIDFRLDSRGTYEHNKDDGNGWVDNWN